MSTNVIRPEVLPPVVRLGWKYIAFLTVLVVALLGLISETLGVPINETEAAIALPYNYDNPVEVLNANYLVQVTTAPQLTWYKAAQTLSSPVDLDLGWYPVMNYCKDQYNRFMYADPLHTTLHTYVYPITDDSIICARMILP